MMYLIEICGVGGNLLLNKFPINLTFTAQEVFLLVRQPSKNYNFFLLKLDT